MVCCALDGCHTTQPVTREILVGSYAYKSNDLEEPATDHEWGHLTLQADGKYELVQDLPVTEQQFLNTVALARSNPQMLFRHLARFNL